MTTDIQDTAPFKEYLLLLLQAALWGGSFTLIKVSLESYPPMTIVTSSVFLGGLILTGLAMLRGDIFPTTLRRWIELMIQGALQGALPFFLITWAEKYVDSNVAGIINSTPPMFVFLITVFVLHSAKFDFYKFIGILAGMSGVALIAMAQSESIGENSLYAVLAVLSASFSYACGAIFGRRFSDQSAFVTGGISLLLAALLIGPAALIFEAPLDLQPTMRATFALIALALLATALASLIFFRLIKTLGSLATTSNAYLRALFSVLLGITFLNEQLSTAIISATVLIFLGAFLVTGQFRNIFLKKLSEVR